MEHQQKNYGNENVVVAKLYGSYFNDGIKKFWTEKTSQPLASERFIRVVILALLFLAVLAGSASVQAISGPVNQSSAEPATGAGVESTDIIIGGNFELTGRMAVFGQSSVSGAKLAFKEVNAAGGVLGKKIDFIVVDNESESTEAFETMNILITRNKAAAVLGAVFSSNTIAAAWVAESNKVPLISNASSHPHVTVAKGKVREYVFRVCYAEPYQGNVMASFASKTLKAKTAAIITDTSSDYAKGMSQAFEETFVKNGGRIVAGETYSPQDSDFRAVLSRIGTAKPDVIFVPGYYDDAGFIVKQSRALGIQAPILGGDGWDSPKLVEIAGKDALANTFFSNNFAIDDKEPRVVRFVANYRKEYGKSPDLMAALAYDSAMLVVDAIQRSGSTAPEKIRDALAQTKGFQAITGVITMDSEHNPIKSVAVIEMKDGRQVFRERVNP